MKFSLTTAIDYPNSKPHMGHAYEKVVADFYARWHRILGHEVHFLIGLDEHGEKIQEAAQKDGKHPQDFVDQKAEEFRGAYKALSISNDDFIRTSEPRHHRFAGEFYKRVAAAGDTYLGNYEGHYCVACESYYTPGQLKEGNCPDHGTPALLRKEESYFFRLGRYQSFVRDHLRSHPEFVFPNERRNELLSRLDEELRDLSVSRCTFNWGVPLPGDPRHVLYVWFDALTNYFSALKEPTDLLERFWPVDMHVIGKDIIWFHAVIWPSMLRSAGIALPRQVFAHGFILDSEGRRMSKTLGNVVDPLEVAARYGAEVLRYYFIRSFASGQDGAFSVQELKDRYASELGNDLGNLLMRVVKLAATKLGGEVGPAGVPAELDFAETVAEYTRCVEAREHHRAVEALWAQLRRTNAYINDRAPWKIAEPERLAVVLYNCFETLRCAAHLLAPIMPATAQSIAEQIGVTLGAIGALRFGQAKFVVTQRPPLFPRFDEPAPLEPKAGDAKRAPTAMPAQPKQPTGSVDPFSAVEVRVGVIKEVRPHPDADALYAMLVDLGESEPRSICAGLRKHIAVEELQGRTVAVVANLKPAKLRGIESRGMVLATDRRDGKVFPVDAGNAKAGDLVTAEGIVSAPRARISIDDFGKAPIAIHEGRAVYRDAAGVVHALTTPAGPITADAADGATVR